MWVKWNESMDRTLVDAEHLAAGDETIAEARERAAKAGTASILSVLTLADHKMLGRIWVLSPAELHEHFGSKTPARKVIEGGQETFIARLEKGQAVAVTAFLRGQAIMVLFAGQPD